MLIVHGAGWFCSRTSLPAENGRGAVKLMTDSLTMMEHALLVKLLEREADYQTDLSRRTGTETRELSTVISALEKIDNADFVFVRKVD